MSTVRRGGGGEDGKHTYPVRLDQERAEEEEEEDERRWRKGGRMGKGQEGQDEKRKEAGSDSRQRERV